MSKSFLGRQTTATSAPLYKQAKVCSEETKEKNTIFFFSLILKAILLDPQALQWMP